MGNKNCLIELNAAAETERIERHGEFGYRL